MKLFKSIAFILIGLFILTTSCNNKKTYAEYLKDERKAIDLLIAKNNFIVLKEFPADSVFGNNEFYKDPETGVYFNIIERGDPARPQWREEIYVRFKGLNYFKDNDTIRYSNYHSVFPEQFEYVGPISSTTRSSYAMPAWVVPLAYVGHKGKVKMIVPFEMGSSLDQSQFEPTYYDQVEYRFESGY